MEGNKLKKKDVDNLEIVTDNICVVWAEVCRMTESLPCFNNVMLNYLNGVPSFFKTEGVAWQFKASCLDDPAAVFHFWSESFGNYRSWQEDKDYIALPVNFGSYRDNFYVQLYLIKKKYYLKNKDAQEIKDLYKLWIPQK